MVEGDRREDGRSRVAWLPRQQERSGQPAVPPWAEPNAQPPPPPSPIYTNLSPSTARKSVMNPVSPISTEPDPTPTHFNRPTPGASPIMVRRSLFRNVDVPVRARSVDSITRSVPWAETKLRATPRTDSPSRAPPGTHPPPWATAGAASVMVDQPQVPRGKDDQPQVPRGKDDQPQVPRGKDDQPQVPPGRDDQPQVPPGRDDQLQAAQETDALVTRGSVSSSSSRTTIISSLSHESVRERREVWQQQQGDVATRPLPASTATQFIPREPRIRGQGSEGQGEPCPPQPSGPQKDVPQQLPSTMASGAAPGKLLQLKSSPTPWRKASGGQVSVGKAAPSHHLRHESNASAGPGTAPPATLPLPAGDGHQPQPQHHTLHQVPWRTPSAAEHHQTSQSPAPAGPSPAPAGPSPAPAGPSPAPAGPSPAPAGPSPAPAGPSPAPAGPSPAPAGPSPAPAGPSPAPAGPSPALAGPSPAPTGPSPAPAGPSPALGTTKEPPRSQVTGKENVKRKGDREASGTVADCEPSWRRHQPKSCPAASSAAAPLHTTVKPPSAFADSPLSPVPGVTKLAPSVPTPVTKQASPVPSSASKPASAVPTSTNKPASAVPTSANKPASAVPTSANKPASAVPTSANKPASAVPTSANKPASAVPTSANKPASAVPTSANKPASAVPTSANKPVSAVSTTANKPATAVTTANKPATAVTTANKPATAVTTANKPAKAVTTANKPATAVTTANKPATAVTTANKPATAVTTANKPATAVTTANKPATAVTTANKPASPPSSQCASPTPIASDVAPASISVAPGTVRGPPAAASAVSVALSEGKVSVESEARWGASPPLTSSLATTHSPIPLAPPLTTHSPTPPLPPKYTSAAVVPQVPKPTGTLVLPSPVPVTTQPTRLTSNAPFSVSLTQPSAVTATLPVPSASEARSAEVSLAEDAAAGVTAESHAMPIPTPPPVPDTKLLKGGGRILSVSGGTATLTEVNSQFPKEPVAAVISSETMRPPQPEFPPPPPVEQMEMLSGSGEVDSEILPPPGFIQEIKTGTPSGFTTRLQCVSEQEENITSPDYVRESVTKRIMAFEKQSSKEEEPLVERTLPVARPVAPWVKRTSSGPVQQERFWDVTSPEPEEPDVNCPAPPPCKEIERTKSPPRAASPREAQQTGTAAVVPAAPPSKVAVPVASPGLKVTPIPASITAAKVAKSHPRPPTTRRQRSASTGDYHAHYVYPDDPRLFKMPAEGNVTGASADKIPTPPKDDELFDPWCDPKNPRIISFQDVSAAAFKIKSGIMNTPCTKSHMSVLTNMEIFFKKEFNQYTGSFKERGARYTLLMLPEEQQKKGVIAASAGNHALALCYHGQDLAIPVTVVMPLRAPIMKVQACRQYGANIIVKGNDIGECREYALKMAKDQGLLYINGYDHPHILAGQGTMGLEIVEQVPNIDAVVIPVGGGGLIAGVALAVKALYPHIQVIGVETERCASFSAAMKAGRPVYVKAESTLADGLAVPMVGVNAFATASRLVDKVVTVREEWIAISILRLVECEKAVVEGAGATGLAAILSGELPELKGKRVVIPLCGGNIDTTVLGRCLERGLAADGRLVKFTVTVSDRPGGIAELTRLLANLGVSIKDMVHERAWIRSDIFSVEVKVMAETKDYEHWLELKAALELRYEKVRFAMPELVHEDP